MKNENFYTIYGWMRNELNLKGNELNIYALIYSFTNAEFGEFTGSLNYIVETIGCDKKTALKCLQSLVDKGYLEKTDIEIAEHLKTVKYRCKNSTGGGEITPGVEKIHRRQWKNSTGGGGKTPPNNNYININNKKKRKNFSSERVYDFENLERMLRSN